MSSPPKSPPHADRSPAADSASHESQAFESDLERHREGDDAVYGAHGVQPEDGGTPPRPAGTKLTRVGQRRRH